MPEQNTVVFSESVMFGITFKVETEPVKGGGISVAKGTSADGTRHIQFIAKWDSLLNETLLEVDWNNIEGGKPLLASRSFLMARYDKLVLIKTDLEPGFGLKPVPLPEFEAQMNRIFRKNEKFREAFLMAQVAKGSFAKIKRV